MCFFSGFVKFVFIFYYLVKHPHTHTFIFAISKQKSTMILYAHLKIFHFPNVCIMPVYFEGAGRLQIIVAYRKGDKFII